ncbi:hypothetical protein LTS17_012420 [Exophiala oligosperma]
MPPRVLPSELRADLVCPEACFRATTKADCFNHLRTWMSHPLWRRGRRISTAEALNVISSRELDSETMQFFAQLGDVNLGILIMSIHSVIFHVRSSIGIQHACQPVQYSLRNWNRVWTLRSLENARQAFGTPSPSEQQTAELSEERWRGPGFMKDCLQFWFLAQLVLSNPTDNHAEYDQADMTYLKSLLRMQHKSRKQTWVGV